MKPPLHKAPSAQDRRIEISLREVGQLFNTMDPSPFFEKDLDADAEEFIVSWAEEIHHTEPLTLVIHVAEPPAEDEQQPAVEKAVQHYFAYRAGLGRLEFRRLMREGRESLITGLVFLTACLVISEMLIKLSGNPMISVLRESLTIGGWVAMWRPMETYLYAWRPLHRRNSVFTRMSRMKVELRLRKPRAAVQHPASETAPVSPPPPAPANPGT